MVYDATDFARVGEIQPKPHDTFNVGFIGSLSFAKMHRNYVSMSASVEIPNVRFVACGGGAIDFLKQEAQQLGALEKFEFRGFVEDIKSEIELFDVYGYPLCEDTYAAAELNLQEAMYGGIPPVVFPYGGVRKLVIDNYTGFVVRSELEYKQAIEYLYHHPEERKRLGKNAQEYAKQIFGAENAAKQLNPIYEQVLEIPKHKREWGIPHDYSILEQPLSLQDLMGRSEEYAGATSFIDALGEKGSPFYMSLSATDTEELFQADAQIASASVLLSMGEGGIAQYSQYYPQDGYLHLWWGLALQRAGAYQQSISELTTATQLGCNHWRVGWYLAQIAEQVNDLELAEKALNSLLETAPEFKPAREMLARIKPLIEQSKHTEQAIKEQFNLREINLILFPDWNASEETLLQQLGDTLKTISNHPKAGEITLLLDLQEMSPEDADLALSSAVMNLMMEEGIELREDLEVSPVGEIDDRAWKTLLSLVNGRISIETEESDRVQEIGAEKLPVYTLDSLSKESFIPKAEQDEIKEQFNLREINLIIFPDWNASEETLLQQLGDTLKTISNHPKAGEITLLLDLQEMSSEDADLALSSAVMNLMMEEGIELREDLEVSPVGEISDRAWKTLLSLVSGRISLDNEENDRVQEIGAEKLPVYTLDSLSKARLDKN
ncbi:UNVERIFIED_CONTAM: hypothetical protein BEN50_18330 [Euhalothece sp. KZN 001]